MRTIFVFALIFLATSALAEVNTKRTSLITKHIYALAQTGYTVDTVVQLLNALLTVSQSNLQDLEDNWATTSAALQDNIATIQALDDAQHQHCADISATISDLQDEVKRYVQYIQDAQDHLEANNENLASRLDARCSGNLLYVGHLKSNQDSYKLLSFLKDQISNPGFKDYLENDNGAFAELHHHLSNKKRATLSLIAKHHMLAMIQQAYTGESNLDYTLEARSDSEIGTGHIDNSQGALSVSHFTIDARNLDDFISQLIGFVESLMQEIDDDTASLQAAEFNAVEDLIDYQDKIEAEATVLNQYITLWVGHINDLQATIEQDGEAEDECEARAADLDNSLEAAEEDFEAKQADFNDRQTSLQHTVDALQECIDVYVNTVANAAIEYKAKFDDEMEEMAEDRARHQAELEEEERAEVEAQEAADRAGAAVSAAVSSSSSAGPISSWVSNQENHEAEEAVAAALASSSSSSSSSSVEASESSSSSSETISKITIETSSATFETISFPTTEWAPIESVSLASSSSSSSSSSASSSLPSVHWSEAPYTTYSETVAPVESSSSVETSSISSFSAGSWEPTVQSAYSLVSHSTAPVWSASSSSSSASSVSFSVPAYVTEESSSSESSSSESSSFNPATWSWSSSGIEISSSESTESTSSAFAAAVSAVLPTVEESSSTVSIGGMFSAAVASAQASVSESYANYGAAAASSSSTSSAANYGNWNSAGSSSDDESASSGAFFQKRGNLRRRF